MGLKLLNSNWSGILAPFYSQLLGVYALVITQSSSFQAKWNTNWCGGALPLIWLLLDHLCFDYGADLIGNGLRPNKSILHIYCGLFCARWANNRSGDFGNDCMFWLRCNHCELGKVRWGWHSKIRQHFLWNFTRPCWGCTLSLLFSAEQKFEGDPDTHSRILPHYWRHERSSILHLDRGTGHRRRHKTFNLYCSTVFLCLYSFNFRFNSPYSPNCGFPGWLFRFCLLAEQS